MSCSKDGQDGHAGLPAFRDERRQDHLRTWLRHGGLGAQRSHHAHHHISRSLDVKAVYGSFDLAAGAGGKAFAGRSGAQVHSRTARLGVEITVRQLIHHTSGLREELGLLDLAGWRYPMDLTTDVEVLTLVSRQKDLNFPQAPGFNTAIQITCCWLR